MERLHVLIALPVLMVLLLLLLVVAAGVGNEAEDTETVDPNLMETVHYAPAPDDPLLSYLQVRVLTDPVVQDLQGSDDLSVYRVKVNAGIDERGQRWYTAVYSIELFSYEVRQKTTVDVKGGEATLDEDYCTAYLPYLISVKEETVRAAVKKLDAALAERESAEKTPYQFFLDAGTLCLGGEFIVSPLPEQEDGGHDHLILAEPICAAPV